MSLFAALSLAAASNPAMPVYSCTFIDQRAVAWYKTLDIHQKIYIKQTCPIWSGQEWNTLTMLFDFRVLISLFWSKLIKEKVIHGGPQVML